MYRLNEGGFGVLDYLLVLCIAAMPVVALISVLRGDSAVDTPAPNAAFISTRVDPGFSFNSNLVQAGLDRDLQIEDATAQNLDTKDVYGYSKTNDMYVLLDSNVRNTVLSVGKTAGLLDDDIEYVLLAMDDIFLNANFTYSLGTVINEELNLSSQPGGTVRTQYVHTNVERVCQVDYSGGRADLIHVSCVAAPSEYIENVSEQQALYLAGYAGPKAAFDSILEEVDDSERVLAFGYLLELDIVDGVASTLPTGYFAWLWKDSDTVTTWNFFRRSSIGYDLASGAGQDSYSFGVCGEETDEEREVFADVLCDQDGATKLYGFYEE